MKDRTRLDIRIDANDKTSFEKTAKLEGRSLSNWIIYTCRQASARQQQTPKAAKVSSRPR